MVTQYALYLTALSLMNYWNSISPPKQDMIQLIPLGLFIVILMTLMSKASELTQEEIDAAPPISTSIQNLIYAVKKEFEL